MTDDAGPARYRVDHYLEDHIDWWRKVAELRRPPVEPALVPVVSLPDERHSA